MYVRSFKELVVWQKSIVLVGHTYRLTQEFPKEETYDLAIQMRRAAVSVPSNIAEGSRRKDVPEYLQFLKIADASSAELETQISLAKRLYPSLDYLACERLLEEIQKMLRAMMVGLETKRFRQRANSSTMNACGSAH